MKRAFPYFVAALLVSAPAYASELPPFTAQDRVLVVAPHPDDEALGAAGLISRAKAAGAAIRIVYLTQGDDNEVSSLFYLKKPLVTKKDTIRIGELREEESETAMKELGVGEDSLFFLGYPDGGLLAIWRKHWGNAKPYHNLLTHINKVPYKESFSLGSYYRGDNIARDLRKTVEDFRPTAVFVTAPFDRHSDHRAAYLFTRLALLELESRIPAPKLYVYVIHARRWPRPRAYRPTERLSPPEAVLSVKPSEWTVFPLTEAETAAKKEAMGEYKSQLAYTKKFMMSFVRTNELFLPAADVPLVSGPPEVPESGRRKPLVHYYLQDGELRIDAVFDDAVDEMGGFGVELYPFRSGRDFGSMPKLRLRFFGKRFSASDASGRVRGAGIRFRTAPGRYQIRVPLALLGSPDRIFVSSSTAKSEPNLDSWKLLEIA